MQQSLEVNAVSASSEVGKGWLKLIGENHKYPRSLLRACIDLRVIHSSGKAPRLTPAHFIAEQV